MAKFSLLLALALFLAYTGQSQRLICSYRNYTTFREGSCSAFPDHDVDPEYCTHLAYGSVGVNSDGSLLTTNEFSDLCDNFGMCGYEKIAFLKFTNPTLRTLFWVGGQEYTAVITQVAQDEGLRSDFVANIVDFVTFWSYDGIVLDWAYPSNQDTWAFTLLLEELREAFDSVNPSLQLGVQVAGLEAQGSYENNALNNADFVIVNAFFYRGLDAGTWHPSPLYRCLGDFFGESSIQTVDHAMSLYSDVDNDKLIVPIYGDGLTFTLAQPGANLIGSDVSDVGDSLSCTLFAGTGNYDEVCDDSWDVYPQSSCLVDFLVKDDQWASVETPNSVLYKAEYASVFGGVAFLHMDGDDFDGSCNNTPFELHSIAYETLGLSRK